MMTTVYPAVMITPCKFQLNINTVFALVVIMEIATGTRNNTGFVFAVLESHLVCKKLDRYSIEFIYLQAPKKQSLTKSTHIKPSLPLKYKSYSLLIFTFDPDPLKVYNLLIL